MSYFTVPLVTISASFLCGIVVAYYLLSGQVNRLTKRLRRLEALLPTLIVEEAQPGYTTVPHTPRPIRPRYVTVDREVSW
jgi:hypothetical protein